MTSHVCQLCFFVVLKYNSGDYGCYGDRNYFKGNIRSNDSDSGSSSDSSEILSSDEEGTSETKVCTRIKDCIEVVHRYSEYEFKTHFRVCRTTVHRVVGLLKESKFQPKNVSGWQYIGAEKAFLLIMWYFSNQETFRQISDRFDVTLSSACRCLRRVVQFLLSIRKAVIVWPIENEKIAVREGFRRKIGNNNIIGAIDGSTDD